MVAPTSIGEAARYPRHRMNSEYKPSPAEKGGAIHSLRELGVDEENRTNVR